MGWFDRMGRAKPRSSSGKVHVADPRFDDWDVVRSFEDLESAQAWGAHLAEAGIDNALTSDWELDRFGRGDISLCVPPGRWSEAEEILGDWD